MMSTVGRFCCRNRHIDGAGRLVHFLKLSIVTRWLCGRLTLDFTDACNAYAAHKGTNGGGRATNLASLRRFCAIAGASYQFVTMVLNIVGRNVYADSSRSTRQGTEWPHS